MLGDASFMATGSSALLRFALDVKCSRLYLKHGNIGQIDIPTARHCTMTASISSTESNIWHRYVKMRNGRKDQEWKKGTEREKEMRYGRE